MRWHEILTEWHDIDPIAEALPTMMRLASSIGYRKGWDGESKINPKDDTEFREWCIERVKAAYAQITKHIIGGDTIRIWRAITLPAGETPDASRHPGVCWTWDEDAIHPAHGTLKDHIWVYEAETTTDQIDWAITIGYGASPNYEQEKEIRLIDYGHVHIIRIIDTGEIK
jgi:hypothetical protein